MEEMKIPERLRDKVAAFPESSMGANRIKVDLVGGKRIYDVVVAGDGCIVRVGTKSIAKPEDLGFRTADIVDVLSEVRLKENFHRDRDASCLTSHANLADQPP